MTDPLKVWEDLRSGSSGDGDLVRRVRTTPPTDVHLGLRMPGRNPMLVLRVDDVPDTHSLTFQSDGLRCAVETGPVTGNRDCAVVLELVDSAHSDVFGVLVADLAGRLAVGMSDDAAVSLLSNRIGRWERLLRRKRDGLTLEQQRGLVGELLVLQRLVTAGLPGQTVVEAWQGPSGGTHDWELSGISLEVKARASTKRSVRISSEFQLETPPDGRMVLVIETIDRVTEGGRSLPELVDETAAMVAAAEGDFRQRLSEYGWFERHRERYAGSAWIVRDEADHDAETEGFPRIVPADLAPGVSGVRYSLEVRALSSARLEAGALEGMINGN